MDNHFKKFCESLEGVLARHEADTDPDEELLFRQRKQLRNLIDLETEFREALIKHRWGRNVYKDFVQYIVATRRNILAARPFFRERHTVFTKYISKALKKQNDQGLYRFRFNWTFINWVMHSREWYPGSEISQLADKISKQRTEILEQNLPLAISQARMFWNATPKSHLSYMDIVQIQCQGLLLAIDKFVPPNDKHMSEKMSLAKYRTFRAVAIGIMTRDRVNNYSETLVHFFPKDRLKMYQANKILRRRTGDINYDEVAAQVTKNLDDATITTTGIEIQSLLAAGSTVSADYSSDEDGESVIYDTHPDDIQGRPDVIYENQQALESVQNAMVGLDLIEKKLLWMKGIKTL
jgi:DNA-directed RNA polymerase specialized sigma subunit